MRCFVLLTRGWGRLETRPPAALGSPPVTGFKIAMKLNRQKNASQACEYNRISGSRSKRRGNDVWKNAYNVKWAGNPRARLLYEWFSSASTACADARGRRVVYMYPPKNGLIALWSATNRWYVVKCVSQKRNRSNNKNEWYNILVNFIFRFN